MRASGEKCVQDQVGHNRSSELQRRRINSPVDVGQRVPLVGEQYHAQNVQNSTVSRTKKAGFGYLMEI